MPALVRRRDRRRRPLRPQARRCLTGRPIERRRDHLDRGRHAWSTPTTSRRDRRDAASSPRSSGSCRAGAPARRSPTPTPDLPRRATTPEAARPDLDAAAPAPHGKPLLFEGYYSLDDSRAAARRSSRRSAGSPSGRCCCSSLVTPMLWCPHRAADPRRQRARAPAPLGDRRLRRRAPADRPRPARRRRPGPRRDGVLGLRGRPRPRRRRRSPARSLHERGALAARQPEVAALAARRDPPARAAVRGARRRCSRTSSPPPRPPASRPRSASRAPRRPPTRRAALVWRVAQEAVRNALRHADASTLAVTVRGDGRRLPLEVVDDGVGFDPDRSTGPGPLRAAWAAQPGRRLRRDAGGAILSRVKGRRCGWRWRRSDGEDHVIRVVLVDDHAVIRAGPPAAARRHRRHRGRGPGGERRGGARRWCAGCAPTSC